MTVIGFDTAHRTFDLSSAHSFFSAYNIITRNTLGGGTNFELIFNKTYQSYDRVIVLSDMQAWAGGYAGNALPSYQAYCKRVGATPRVFSFDLAGYGTLAFPADKIYQLFGFSDKAFDVLTQLEAGDRDAMVHEIEKVVL